MTDKKYRFKMYKKWANAKTSDKRREIMTRFELFLDSLGWEDNIMEGGYISPDRSTIIWYGRSPYYFQIGRYSREAGNYTTTIGSFEFMGLIEEVK